MKIAVESACLIKIKKPRQSFAYEKLGFRGSLKIPLMILNGGISMTKDWKPVDSQVLVDAWDEIKDCAEGIQKDLACPDETISKMLRSVAETFDNTVEDILDKAEEDWEEDK